MAQQRDPTNWSRPGKRDRGFCQPRSGENSRQTHNGRMRAALTAALISLAAPLGAQTSADAGVAGGQGYSTISSTRGSTAPPPAAPALAPSATVTTVGARPALPSAERAATSGASRGPRGPSVEPSARGGTGTVTVTEAAGASAAGSTFTLDRRGQITAPASPPATGDAGVDDPTIPTAGALFGGPLPGPTISYMGQPVNTRHPPPAPPLAPGAVRPTHALPGSTAAPPGGAAPWIPHTTSGFQLGPRGSSTELGGYGFQMPSGARENPGTLRNSP